jgi:hypothetical protein
MEAGGGRPQHPEPAIAPRPGIAVLLERCLAERRVEMTQPVTLRIFSDYV